MGEKGLTGRRLFVSNNVSETKKTAFPLKKLTVYLEGAIELAPSWVKPSLSMWSAEATQLLLLKGRDLLPHPLVYLFPSPGLVSLSFPLS